MKSHAAITVAMVLLGMTMLISAQNSPILQAVLWLREKVTQPGSSTPNTSGANPPGTSQQGSSPTNAPPLTVPATDVPVLTGLANAITNLIPGVKGGAQGGFELGIIVRQLRCSAGDQSSCQWLDQQGQPRQIGQIKG